MGISRSTPGCNQAITPGAGTPNCHECPDTSMLHHVCLPIGVLDSYAGLH